MEKQRIRVPANSRRSDAVAQASQASAGTLMLPKRARTERAAADPASEVFRGTFHSRGSADRHWLHERLAAVARTRQIVANEPVAQSIVEQKVGLVVGEGWRFVSTPSPAMFGLSAEDPALDRLATSIETEFEEWANDPHHRCDYEEELDFDLMLDLVVRGTLVDGEALALVNWVERDDDFPFSTAIQLVDPDRLANPMAQPDSEYVRAGVRFDERGRRTAYHILDAHPHDVGLACIKGLRGTWIDRFEVPGRPRVLHVYRKVRPGQTRGVSRLVAALSRLQMLRDLNESELRSRILNALIFASYTSNMDPEVIKEMFEDNTGDQLLNARDLFYESSGTDQLGGHRIVHNFPGDELTINEASRDVAPIADVVAAIALQAGGAAGMGGSLAMRDFSRVTFSSARTEINDAYRDVLRERQLVKKLFARPVQLCIAQESFDAGRLDLPPGAPDIYDKPSAYTDGEHIGPGREMVDSLKEGAGDRLEVENLTSAPSEIAARRGKDFRKVIARAARDKREIERAGVEMGDIANFAGVGGGENDAPSGA